MLMAEWPEGLMVVNAGASMAVVVPVGGASLSGSNSSSIMRVLCVSLVGCGGGGERGRGMLWVLLCAAQRAGRTFGGRRRGVVVVAAGGQS